MLQSFNKDSLTAWVGSTVANTLTAFTDGTITYVSSDPSVAKVDNNGTITALARGTATITATSAEGTNYHGGTASYTLSVSVAPSSDDDTEGSSDVIVPENGTTTKTVEGEDGSTSTIVTETTGSTVTNEDGSVTDITTEKVTENETDAEGNVTRTETVTENETTTNTVKNADGSTTETTATRETTTESVTVGDETVNKKETVNSSKTTSNTVINADGSTTAAEETTSTVTEIATATDGSSTVAETETTINTKITGKTNADGSATETAVTAAMETMTTTVTAADGTVTESVAETTRAKTLETTATADGKTTGSGTVSSTTTVTAADGSKSTVKTEGTITVDTDTKGTVREVTTEKTVTTAADGSTTEATTVTTAAATVVGSTATVVEDENGNVLSAEVTISEEAVDKALESDEPINVPVSVNPAEDYASGKVISFTMPFFEDKLEVEIEVKRDGPGIVAFIRQPGGELSLVKECRRGSLIIPVETNCEIVIADNTKRFPDVGAEKWFYDPVTFVTAREIFTGYDDGSFGPEKTMNRAMVAQILYNLSRNAAPGNSRFSDVAANAWYSAAVSWAAEKGVVQGYDGKYYPLEVITRQDLVTIFYRYVKFAGYELSVGKDASLADYTDGAEVSDYAAEAMRWAISKGIVTGYEDGSLRPKDTATRAQVTAVMQRFIENVVR